jgi:hypothetical protein
VSPCPVCRRRIPATPQVCEPDRARIARLLATIPDLVVDAGTRYEATHESAETANDPVSRALPAGPVPAVSSGPRVSGSSTPAAPIDLDLVDTRATHNPLTIWANEWWRPGDALVTDVTAWLRQHLDRACDEDGEQVARFASDLDHYAAQLRRAACDTRQLLGYCPTEDCGSELRADPRDQAAVCPTCNTAWPRRHWLWLADTLRPAA